jgi:signal transduction histidine kinase
MYCTEQLATKDEEKDSMDTIAPPHLAGEAVAAAAEQNSGKRWPFPAALVSRAMPELEQLLLAVLNEACRRLHATSGAIWLIDPATGALVRRQATGRRLQKHGGGSVRYALQRGVGLITSNRSSQPVRDLGLSEPGQNLLKGNGKPPAITIPLVLRGTVVGALQLIRSGGARFGPHDLDLLEALVTPTALALEQVLETVRLRQQVTDLQAQERELDAFAQTVAHDLKNPLSLIMGYAGFLAEGYASDEAMEKSLQQIVRSSRKMQNIIDGLLLLAGAEDAGHLEMGVLDTASIVDDVRERLEHLIQDAHAEIIAPEHWPPAMGHRQWVEEVWANYISNAVKYGGQPPRVELGADLVPNNLIADTRRVRFWVRDNGRGLTTAEQARLFMPFTRLGMNAHQGNGLGLSIVRRIVHKLGGEVDVTSQPGQGSVFSFTLPAVTL